MANWLTLDTFSHPRNHRRRIKTEENGKGRRCCLGDKIYSIPCHASYIFCTRLISNNMMTWSFSLNHPGAIHPILQIVLVQNGQRSKEFNNFCPPNSSDDLCLFFCLYPSSKLETDWQVRVGFVATLSFRKNSQIFRHKQILYFLRKFKVQFSKF